MSTPWLSAEQSALLATLQGSAPWQTDQLLDTYLTLVCQALEADSAGWLAAYRGDYGRDTPVIELLDNWKVMDMAHSEADRGAYLARGMAYQALAERKQEVDPLTREAINQTGQHRTHRLSAHLGQDERPHWVQTEHFHQYQVKDRLLGVFSLNAEAESYVIVNRSERPFTAADEATLLRLVKAFPRLHDWLMLERGLAAPSDRPLSPRQQTLLHLLLQPLSRTQVAEQLGLAESTVHSYTIALYRNFAVGSRTELQSRWLAPL